MSGTATLEQRIKRLEDLEEIRGLRMRYHYCVNEHIYAQAAEIHTEDAFVSFGKLAEARGKAEIAALYERLENNVTLIRQFPCQPIVTLDGDRASAVCYLDARYAQQGTSIIAAVTYFDQYVRTPEGWRMSEMIVRVDFAVPLEQGWAGGELDATRLIARD